VHHPAAADPVYGERNKAPRAPAAVELPQLMTGSGAVHPDLAVVRQEPVESPSRSLAETLSPALPRPASRALRPAQ
jgi:hypothetical protein